MTTLAELVGSRELLANLTGRELRGKYKGSVIGWAWSMINPLALAGMFTLFYTVILHLQAPAGAHTNLFPLFLLCGLLPWNFFANAVNGGMGSLTGNANLVKKVYFPREILIDASVLSWLVSVLIELVALGIALLVAGNNILPWIPVVLLLVAVTGVFATGIGLALSMLNVYFRDVQHFWGIALQLWFYGSPIIYPIQKVTQTNRQIFGIKLIDIYRVNPMADLLDAFHRVLYNLEWPLLWPTVWAVTAAFGTLLLGRMLFLRLEPRLAEEL